MEKKESHNPDIEPGVGPKPSLITGKLSDFYYRSFGIIKFILGILALPFVYSSTAAFLNEFYLIEKPYQNYFWFGLIAFVLIYLFVWEPTIIYAKGQRLLEAFFQFFKPLVRVAPYLLPIYTIVLFIIYWLLSFNTKSEILLKNSIFLFGFSIALHLVFSAKSIRARKSDFLKANYIFGLSLLYIINVALLSFCLNLIFNEFSFVNFSNNTFKDAKNIFCAVFKQLF
jgi:hypothetical protein